MSVNNQQVSQAVRIIEEQLVILKQAISGVDVGGQEGIVGIFDGEFMVEEGGKRHQVPPNYASKTMLVPGDTVRMIEDSAGGQTKYKQIGKVERSKTEGVLVKKDGKFEVLSEEGSFKVLSAAIKHYNGEVGDQVFIQYPKQHVKGSWAAVEKVVNQSRTTNVTSTPEIQPVLAEIAPSPGLAQPAPLAHVQEVRTPTPQPTALPVKGQQPVSSEAKRPSKPASKDRSSSKPTPAPQRSGSKSNSSKPRNSDNKPTIAATPPTSAPSVGNDTSPANQENIAPSFGDDDLI